MSYSISISGHGASKETVERVFTGAVQALRAEQAKGSGPVSGSATGGDPDGNSISLSAADVPEAGSQADAEAEPETT